MNKTVTAICILSVVALAVVIILFNLPADSNGKTSQTGESAYQNRPTDFSQTEAVKNTENMSDSDSNVMSENVESSDDLTDVSAGNAGVGEESDSEVNVVDGEESDSEENVSDSGVAESNDNEENDNIVIVLDPGHGGKRTGAIYSGITEKDITLKVANYCRSYLLLNYSGVEVYLTREEDIELDPDNVIDLEMRAICAEENKADALISIHFNACDKHNLKGTTIFISRRAGLKEPSMALAEKIMKEFTSIGLKNNGIGMMASHDMFDENGEPYDYYAINRHCAARNIPGLIVEQCFMDNESDQQYLLSESGLQQLGQADAIGIAEYFGLEKN